MTKKHFQMIADVIKAATCGYEVREAMAKDFARRLAAENPRFDAARFYTACGVVPLMEWTP